MLTAQRIAVFMFGLLVVGFRLPGVIAPDRYKAWLARNFLTVNKRADVVGVIAVTAAVQVLAFLWDASTVNGVLSIMFGFALLALAVIAFLWGKAKDAIRKLLIEKIARNDSVCRALCLVGVIVGIAILVVSILGI